MISKLILLILLGAILAFASCNKAKDNTAREDTKVESSPALPANDQPKFDACSLLTREEIAAVEGSTVIDTKNSGRSDAGLASAQCFYTTETFSKSVSLAITKPDPDATPKRSIKEYWEGMFGKFENEGKEGEHEAEKLEHAGDKEKSESLREQRKEWEGEHESVAPKKIEGVGDEAFWLASRVGGALYVFGKESFIRVSVGGPDPEEKKIEKCKALAQKALARL